MRKGHNKFVNARFLMILLPVFLFHFQGTGSVFAQCPVNQNLIVNGNADAQPALTGNVDHDVADWGNETGGFTVIPWGLNGGYPTVNDPGPPDRGTHLFSGSASGVNASATQTIDLNACSTLIDSGLLPYTISGYFGGFAGQNDTAQLTVSFLNALNQATASQTIGPVTNTDRGNATGLLLRSFSGNVPIGTRSVIFTLRMTHRQGDNDGYADSLFFSLLVPTAAGVVVGGRVVDGLGRSISGASVSLIGLGSGFRTARTNSFGFFIFEDVEAGQSFVLEVRAKGLTFESRLISTEDSVDDLLIVASGGESLKSLEVSLFRNGDQ